MKVVWSDEAIEDYNQNIEYLERVWSFMVASEFIQDTVETIELICRHSEIYPVTSYKKIRKAVIRKQITLLFTIKNEEIHLIRFWNTYQNPDKLKL